MELAIFQEYEKDYQSIASQYSNETDAKAELRRIEADLTTARQRLADMQTEARGFPDATRRQLGDKIKQYQSALDSVSQDLRRAQDKFNRSALMGSPGGSKPLDFEKSLDQRQRMEASTDKMRGGTRTLNEAHGRLDEALNVVYAIMCAGEGIMGELARNRETLHRVRGNVGLLSSTLDEGRRILRSMSRREVRTKIALGVFAVVLTAIIIGLIVWIVKSKNE